MEVDAVKLSRRHQPSSQCASSGVMATGSSASSSGGRTGQGKGKANQKGKGKGVGRVMGACYRCGEQGHFKNNCQYSADVAEDERKINLQETKQASLIEAERRPSITSWIFGA